MISPFVIDPAQYLQKTDNWSLLKRYIEDHAERYPDIDPASAEYLVQLNKACKAVADVGDRDLVRRALRSLSDKKTKALSRRTILRLIYVLRINTLQKKGVSTAAAEADLLLTEYLHEPKLSVRNLEEFVFVCALNLNYSWDELSSLLQNETIRDVIAGQPVLPNLRESYEEETQDIFEQTDDLKNEEEILQFVTSHRNFFAYLGNTHYFSLFNDVCICPVERNGAVNYRLVEDITTFKMNYEKTGDLQMKEYYNRLFGLWSMDEEREEYRNHLDVETIRLLTGIFPNVFLTQEVFNNLVQRRRTTDISSGTFLLHLLTDLPPETYESVGLQETNPDKAVKAFRGTVSFYLNTAGFPSLNVHVPLDKLVLDVYRHVVKTAVPGSRKETFLYHFRDALKQIASS